MWTAIVDDAARIGCRYFDLTGGEPALYPDVERLITHIRSTRRHLELQCNGVLLTRTRLESLWNSGLEEIVISLDGEPARHDLIRGRAGTYELAIDAIRHAVAIGFSVRVTRVVVDDEGLEDVLPFAQGLDELGVGHLSINRFSPVTPRHFVGYRSPDPHKWIRFTAALEQLAGQIRYPVSYEVGFARPHEIAGFIGEETRCLIERKKWFLVRADGEVFPCYHFVHSPEMSLGNVRDVPLSRMVGDNHPAWRAYAGLKTTPSGCTSCEFSTSCGGGCPSPGYLQLGSLSVKDLRCRVEDGFLPVCPFVKRTAGTSHQTNIAPYYYAAGSLDPNSNVVC